MASSRRVPGNENISTYNSAGGADYSAFSTWESATDNDMVTAEQGETLEIQAHGSQLHDDNGVFAGGTADATYFRGMRAVSTARHNGQPATDGSQAGFEKDALYTTADVLRTSESYSFVEDIILKRASNATANKKLILFNNGSDQASMAGLAIIDSDNIGLGEMMGIECSSGTGEDSYIIDCLIYNIGDDGIRATGTSSFNAFVYNCTIIGCGDDGIDINIGTFLVKNCILNGNGGSDIEGSATETTNIKTADGTPAFVNAAGRDYRLKNTDTLAKGAGTSLAADSDYPFDDDIRLNTRTNWDVGGFRYQYQNSVNGKAESLIASISGVDIDKIQSISGV